MSNIVKRTTLVVRDIEKSLVFYRDILGMTLWYDDEVVLSGVGLAAGKAGDRTHLMIMKCDDPVVGMIGLLQFTDPPLPAPPIPSAVGIGSIVFVWQSDDVLSVYEKLKAADARIHAEPHRFEITGHDGNHLQMTSISFFDPDGYFIEMNQRH
jgi:catechol 2,3-dioxygenase-like lactoylglutathione lyase family enzyme